MLIYKSGNILARSMFLSKTNVVQSQFLPKLEQIQLSVKVVNAYDLVTNLILLGTLTTVLPKSILVNRKQSLTIPRVLLNGLFLQQSLHSLVTTCVGRLADKVLSVSFNASSNKVTFIFKASDIIPIIMQKFCKVIGNELGMFTCEITLLTNSSQIL